MYIQRLYTCIYIKYSLEMYLMKLSMQKNECRTLIFIIVIEKLKTHIFLAEKI